MHAYCSLDSVQIFVALTTVDQLRFIIDNMKHCFNLKKKVKTSDVKTADGIWNTVCKVKKLITSCLKMNPDIPATSSAKNTSTRNIAYYTGGGKEKMLKNKSTKKIQNIIT